jgi:photosystem I subunit 9
MKLQCHLAKFFQSPYIYIIKIMENFQKYLSTAPVLLTIWMTFTAGFIIEINRFFPDMLGLYF